jgi:hypothetical protein
MLVIYKLDIVTFRGEQYMYKVRCVHPMILKKVLSYVIVHIYVFWSRTYLVFRRFHVYVKYANANCL